jgi:hypothetical protein
VHSNRLRRAMFLEPSKIGIVIPLRVVSEKLTRLGMARRNETIWAPAPSIPPALLTSHLVRGHTDRLPNDALLDLCKGKKVEQPTLNPTLEYWCINRKMDTILLKESPASHAEMALRLVPHSYKQLPKHDSRRNMLVTQPPVADVVIGRSDTLWGLFEAHNPRGVTVGDLLDAEERRYGITKGVPTTKFIGWTSG